MRRPEPGKNSDRKSNRTSRVGGVAGKPGGVRGGAWKPAPGTEKSGCTLKGRRSAESQGRGGGSSGWPVTADHLQ